MVLVVALLFWAGWHNLRSRRVAMQQAQQAQVTVQKDSDAGMPGDAITVNLVGKTAPAFTLLDLSGKKVSLADFKGKPVVVNFWATYCGPCQEEMPWFESFTTQYASQGLVVLGVDLEDGVTKEAIEKASRKLGVTYPILLGDEKTGKDYGVGDYLPVTAYVGKDGNVVEQVPGGADSKDVIEAHIRKIAGGQ
jgi:thiol-disulfide isomerase/thioredoxin